VASVRLTSLLLVEERLLEADYFALRLVRQWDSYRFRYELNAFLSAARSVTFVLQKEMAAVPGFSAWWATKRKQLAEDTAAAFFHNLRNFSQKEGRVSLVGSKSTPGPRGRWTYRFAGNQKRVPPTLLHRDVAECCREHVSKLASIVLDCTEAFPYHSCPRRAITLEGIVALKLSVEDIEETIGLPRGWTASGDPAMKPRRIKLLRDEVDGLDFPTLKRLARWKAASVNLPEPFDQEILDSLVCQLEEDKVVSTAKLAVSLVLGKSGQRQ
jgi:hypothetical protein